jgi:hypothetical protein
LRATKEMNAGEIKVPEDIAHMLRVTMDERLEGQVLATNFKLSQLGVTVEPRKVEQTFAGAEPWRGEPPMQDATRMAQQRIRQADAL